VLRNSENSIAKLIAKEAKRKINKSVFPQTSEREKKKILYLKIKIYKKSKSAQNRKSTAQNHKFLQLDLIIL
jgi:hypothetical protein